VVNTNSDRLRIPGCPKSTDGIGHNGTHNEVAHNKIKRRDMHLKKGIKPGNTNKALEL